MQPTSTSYRTLAMIFVLVLINVGLSVLYATTPVTEASLRTIFGTSQLIAMIVTMAVALRAMVVTF